MRAFIGIPFDYEVSNYLEQTKQVLLTHTFKSSPSRKETFHLTLLFIGDIDINQQESIENKLEAVTNIPKFNILLTNPGTFNKGKESVLWIGVKDELGILKPFQQTIVNLVNSAGFNFQFIPYQPHITLARRVVFNNSIDLKEVIQYSESIQVTHIHLYESHQINGILTYTPMKTFKLK